MKKKIKDKYAIIIILVLTFTFLILFYFIIADNRKLSLPEKIIKEGILFTEKIIYTPVKFVTNKIDTFIEMKDLYNNLKEKEEKIKMYDVLENNLKEKSKQIKELESLLEIKNNLNDYTSINATVINRNVGNWYDTLTIDKGMNDGIKEGMAVITSYGLVGKIMKVTNNTSTIKLLTSINETFQISIKIEVGEDYLYGLLSNYRDNYLMISGISDNREIPNYSKVTTTGLDNIFPSGILIGYTEKEEKDNFDLARTIYVTPSHNFDDINYVSVLKRSDSE